MNCDTIGELRARLEAGDFTPLSQLFSEGLLPRLTTLTMLAMEQHEPLMDLAHVASTLGIREDALRQRVQRGKHLAITRGKKLYSHPRLAL